MQCPQYEPQLVSGISSLRVFGMQLELLELTLEALINELHVTCRVWYMSRKQRCMRCKLTSLHKLRSNEHAFSFKLPTTVSATCECIRLFAGMPFKVSEVCEDAPPVGRMFGGGTGQWSRGHLGGSFRMTSLFSYFAMLSACCDEMRDCKGD